MKKLFVSLLILGVIACKKNPEKFINDRTDSTESVKTDATKVTQVEVSKDEALKQLNEEIIQALKDKDYKRFSDFIHPEKGVRFSMYAFVNPKEDKNFSKSDFIKYQPTKTLFTWGTLDGSGELYKATIDSYLTKWVYSKDFATGQVAFNEFLGKGNSLNNLKEIYPKADFTENYMKGSEANAEMDWKSLRLVLEKLNGKYYLVAVVNDQWTI
ncbi:MAG: hypothetical protein DI622_00675 [Chryseobacterium sp.]|uniref:hypothetical protein n=1 Tax=Chryseobacterium sp. TaxID=1871047 RepID=UPI000DAF8808|nr:hypothetical protein [Chryseobacterium sp.]MPS65606.1 hypothetical protein [Chryseobacterium sp.]PZU26476.1 MAG: hypothetical protein DI622_00675 [Chryseobacterium sp.]